MKQKLPKAFLQEMEALLGEEYPAFLASYDKPAHAGLRINTLKGEVSLIKEKLPFSLKEIPWISNGFTYLQEERPALSPYFYAGLFYIQEPSAMTPASLLPIEPGDLVLDLCAAPGGKATELGAKLKGTGFLLANDISNSRAKALLKNLERCGIANMAVTSEAPGKLAGVLPETFDKILIDAPCSGEGMFRRDPGMAEFWKDKGPEFYSKLQRELVLQAADLLKPGGMMLFSTCTFAKSENEETIRFLLRNREDVSVIPIQNRYGKFSHGYDEFADAVRIFPHQMDGEGHFAVLLQKKERQYERKQYSDKMQGIKLPKAAEEFLSELIQPDFLKREGCWQQIRDCIYYIPRQPVTCQRLRFLRTGLLAGEMKKDRFEPSQALAMALKKKEYPRCIDFPAKDERVYRYLKGETVFVPEETLKGWVLVCTDGFPLGWAKAANGTLKNKYPAGWRML